MNLNSHDAEEPREGTAPLDSKNKRDDSSPICTDLTACFKPCDSDCQRRIRRDTVPYQHWPNGLYLIKQRSQTKGVDHYAVLDIGNRLGLILAEPGYPVVIHQTPPRISISLLRDTGEWQVLGQVPDEQDALARLRLALNQPGYNVVFNNCEQVAKFVATGRHESTQVQTAAAVIGLVALVWAGARAA